MTTKTKSKTPAEVAGERLAEYQAAVTAHEERERKLSAEVEEHQRKADAGDLDYDSLGHIRAEAGLRAERRWIEVQRPHLTEARKVHDSFVLADSVGDLLSRREALEGKREESIAKVRKALDEYAEAVTAYNSELTEHIATARQAGLIEDEADPTLPVLMSGGTHGHPRRLVIEGEHFTVLSTNTDPLVRPFLRTESNSIGGSL